MSSSPDDDGVLYEDQVAPEPGVLGMTLRELLIVAVWLVAFVVSFFDAGGGGSVWQSGIQWLLPVGVPTIAVFLIVLRRFSPDGIRRVGSLGVDQFASVAFSVAAVLWISWLWQQVQLLLLAPGSALGWVTLAESVLFLALVALTVAAPFIPGLREDFHGRLETLAHRNANPVRPILHGAPSFRRTAAEETPLTSAESEEGEGPAPFLTADSIIDASPEEVAPEAVSDVAASSEPVTDGSLPEPEPEPFAGPGFDPVPEPEPVPEPDPTPWAEEEPASSPEPAPHGDGFPDELLTLIIEDDDGTTHEARPEPDPGPAVQPFWILAPTIRIVHDERGAELFRIGPEAWALVIEDRGGAYVVRHDDGRIGYLHDISDTTKG